MAYSKRKGTFGPSFKVSFQISLCSFTQADLKRQFTQLSVCPFSRVASHITDVVTMEQFNLPVCGGDVKQQDVSKYRGARSGCSHCVIHLGSD